MAIGDDATAAGLPLVPATADVRKGYDHHNATRDMIAQRTATITPVAKGGTGADTAAGARSNLGVPAADAVAMRNSLGFANAIAQLSAHELGIYFNDAADRFVFRKKHAGNTVDVPIATDGAYVSKTGDTMTGDLRLPNATPATSGYVAAYINGDGRISKGASSERYKKHITAIDPAVLGDIFPQLHRFQMRQGEPGAWKYGWIAERLAEQADTAPFVVHNEQGVPESIDFIALLIAQNAQLHQALDILTQRIDALEVDRAAH